MYRCATVEQALKDQVMRNIHLEKYLYIRATSFERLSDTSLNLFPYWYFTHDSLWASFHTDISPMTTLNISIYTYFNDDYFEHVLHLYVNNDCFEHLHMHLFQRGLSVWTILRAPVSTLIHFEHRAPEGRPGMSDVSLLSGISGLSFDSLFLSLLSFFCLVLLLLLFCHFSANGPFSWLFPKKLSNIFRWGLGFFVWLLLSS